MQYEFLKAFPRRMKNVGLYALLITNSSQKAIWKKYGFDSLDEQLNMVFSVMLYVMEQSLKEDNCTIDDISAFMDSINSQYFSKGMSFNDCHELGDFIINNVLANEGRTMHFKGYDYDEMTYRSVPVSYIANRIVYVEQDVRRTSYYLTDDGYNLLLGTLEVESNLKLTIQEMVFKLHLEKQSYDKALDDIKNVFNLMRIQLQKLQEAMQRIRRNALDYNVSDYARLLQEDLDTIDQTKEKFKNYRDVVRARVAELQEKEIDVNTLEKEDEEKLRNLREIENYLNRAIDEHQKILNKHFDLKALYTNELEKITEMSLVQRFSLRTELFDKILEYPEALGNMDKFLRPLLNRNPGKIYNMEKVLEFQRVRLNAEDEMTDETEDFDEEAWQEEQERLRQQKLSKYRLCLTSILAPAIPKGKITLSKLVSIYSKPKSSVARKSNIEDHMEDKTADNAINTINNAAANAEGMDRLVPNIQIFKEVMVELLKNRLIDIAALRSERASFLQDNENNDFHLNEMILEILDDNPDWPKINKIKVSRIDGVMPVIMENLPDENGSLRNIRCSEVMIRLSKEQGVR